MTEIEQCPHGKREKKSGISRGGRAWSGWFCTHRVCPVEWIGADQGPAVEAYKSAVDAAKDACNATIAEARRLRDQLVDQAELDYKAATDTKAVPF